MEMVSVRFAKTHLSRLVEKAARGESFIITKRGKPMVKVVPVDVPTHEMPRRLGFMAGQIKVPDDFDRMGEGDIVRWMDDGRPSRR